MKFLVSTTALLKELQTIGGLISTNSVLPILDDFLFEIKENTLTVSSSDLETSMSATLPVESKNNLRIAIPARMLVDTLKSLPEQPLTFSIDKQTYAIEITSQNGKYKLAGENGDDFPKIPSGDDMTEMIIPATVLRRAIQKTVFAVSTDELRPAMTGVYFQLDKDGLTFVATDAHKLVRMRRTDARNNNSAKFIIPKKALTLLNHALSDDGAGVRLSFNSTNAFFAINNISLICRFIDAKYPDYNAVIPGDNPNSLTIDRADFQRSLQRIAIYSNKTTHQIVLKITGSELVASAQDLDFSNEATERLTCKYEGEDIEIGFNAKFLTEMLGVMDTSEVVFQLSTPTRAGILVPSQNESSEELLMLIMPVMLNA